MVPWDVSLLKCYVRAYQRPLGHTGGTYPRLSRHTHGHWDIATPHRFRGVEVRGCATLMGVSEVTSQI